MRQVVIANEDVSKADCVPKVFGVLVKTGAKNCTRFD